MTIVLRLADWEGLKARKSSPRWRSFHFACRELFSFGFSALSVCSPFILAATGWEKIALNERLTMAGKFISLLEVKLTVLHNVVTVDVVADAAVGICCA